MKNLFTERITELIEFSNKMQKDICEELGITRQKLTKWKLGYNEPSLDELIMIANYFNVTSDYLLGLEDDMGMKVR